MPHPPPPPRLTRPSQQQTARTSGARSPPQRNGVEALQTTVRIDVEQLDTLMNMVGELVIDRTRVSQLSRLLQGRFKEDEYVSALAETSTHIAKVVDELHESMMSVRMLPVGLLFSKFPRLVRDLSRDLDRQVTLAVEGEDTEIDRSVIEKIKDPLVHLIRNSVDHGIEPAEERAALASRRHRASSSPPLTSRARSSSRSRMTVAASTPSVSSRQPSRRARSAPKWPSA